MWALERFAIETNHGNLPPEISGGKKVIFLHKSSNVFIFSLLLIPFPALPKPPTSAIDGHPASVDFGTVLKQHIHEIGVIAPRHLSYIEPKASRLVSIHQFKLDLKQTIAFLLLTIRECVV